MGPDKLWAYLQIPSELWKAPKIGSKFIWLSDVWISDIFRTVISSEDRLKVCLAPPVTTLWRSYASAGFGPLFLDPNSCAKTNKNKNKRHWQSNVGGRRPHSFKIVRASCPYCPSGSRVPGGYRILYFLIPVLKETTQFRENLVINFCITIGGPLFMNYNSLAKFTANFVE